MRPRRADPAMRWPDNKSHLAMKFRSQTNWSGANATKNTALYGWVLISGLGLFRKVQFRKTYYYYLSPDRRPRSISQMLICTEQMMNSIGFLYIAH